MGLEALSEACSLYNLPQLFCWKAKSEEVEKYLQEVSIDIDERSIIEVLLLSNLGQALGQSGKTLELAEKAKILAIGEKQAGTLPYIIYNIAFETC